MSHVATASHPSHYRQGSWTSCIVPSGDVVKVARGDLALHPTSLCSDPPCKYSSLATITWNLQALLLHLPNHDIFRTATSNSKSKAVMGKAKTTRVKAEPYTNDASKPASPVDVLPPELIRMIADNVDRRDWLSLKLSCKSFHAAMLGTLTQMLTAYSDVITATLGIRIQMQGSRYYGSISTMHQATFGRFERQHCHRALLSRLLCTHCNKHKSRDQFSDSQARTTKPPSRNLIYPPGVMWDKGIDRACITCCTHLYHMKNYSILPSILIGGRKHWVCQDCKRGFPIEDGASENGSQAFVEVCHSRGGRGRGCDRQTGNLMHYYKYCRSCDQKFRKSGLTGWSMFIC